MLGLGHLYRFLLSLSPLACRFISFENSSTSRPAVISEIEFKTNNTSLVMLYNLDEQRKIDQNFIPRFESSIKNILLFVVYINKL